MMAPERWVWLARIKRTQGRKGEVFAEILTDFPEKFSERRRLWLLCERTSASATTAASPSRDAEGEHPREIELLNHWLHKGGIVLHFAGIDSISAAEELAGMVVAIPSSERASLDEGAIYIGDLIGCMLVNVAGDSPHVVGEIEDVDRSAGRVAMLVVRAASSQNNRATNPPISGGEILIPFAQEYLRRVDVNEKRLEMALPEGLVDLNQPTNT